LIKNILENNPTPPIVVVISDHGFRLLVDRPLHDIQSEKYSNFCAMYFPDKDYRNLYDSITPINVLRAVLNKAISTKFNRLPDLSGLSN
jgi:hypothetical protein